MAEKVKVDLELPIKCSTVKNTLKNTEGLLNFIWNVMDIVLLPIVTVIIWCVKGYIILSDLFDKFIPQIFGCVFMVAGFVLIYGAIFSTQELALQWASYILGPIAVLFGLTMSILSSVEYYNIDLNIKCKQDE